MQILLNIFIPTLSFLLCILTANYLSKTVHFSFLESRENRFRSLDGIRGFLALSVFFHHFILTYYWKVNDTWGPPPEDIFQNLGKVGVAVFFMITGFLFISKITKTEVSIKWLQLYQSRAFRIVPLYLFALGIITLIVFSNSNFQLNVTFMALSEQYIKWGVFHGGNLNGFSDTRRIIAGVDWTLKYEWAFYLALPILAIFIKKLKTISAVCIIICSQSL